MLNRSSSAKERQASISSEEERSVRSDEEGRAIEMEESAFQEDSIGVIGEAPMLHRDSSVGLPISSPFIQSVNNLEVSQKGEDEDWVQNLERFVDSVQDSKDVSSDEELMSSVLEQPYSGDLQSGPPLKSPHSSDVKRRKDPDSDVQLQRKLKHLWLKDKIVYIDMKIKKLTAMRHTLTEYDPHSSNKFRKHTPKRELFPPLPFGVKRKKVKYPTRRIMTASILQSLKNKFEVYHSIENSLGLRTLINKEGVYYDLTKIAQVHGICQTTTYNLYRQWLRDPDFSVRLQKLFMSKNPSGRAVGITRDRIEFIQELVTENPYLCQSDLVDELNKYAEMKCEREGRQKNIDHNMISKLIRLGNFKVRKTQVADPDVDTPENVELRRQFCNFFKGHQPTETQLIYIDEINVNLLMCRHQVWSRHNKDLISERLGVNHLTVFAMFISPDKAYWKLAKALGGKYTQMECYQALQARVAENEGVGKLRKYLLLDSCALDNQRGTQELESLFNVKAVLLPPGSSQASPVQIWFQDIKKALRVSGCMNNEDLLLKMNDMLTSYEQFNFIRYFEDMGRYVDRVHRTHQAQIKL